MISAKFFHSLFTFWWQKPQSVTVWMTRSKKGWNNVTAQQDWCEHRLIRKKLWLVQIYSTKIVVRKADRNSEKNSSLNISRNVGVRRKINVTHLNLSHFQGAEDTHLTHYFRMRKKTNKWTKKAKKTPTFQSSVIE